MIFGQPKIEYKNLRQMQIMRQAGLILSEALDVTVSSAKPGMSTAELDVIFRGILEERGAISNFLGYHGFPAAICASVNEEVVHGIPGPRVLEPGDVLKIDGGAIVDGWHSDSARTVILGSEDEADPEDLRLSRVTEEAMWGGIAAAAQGSHVGDIGSAIDDFVSAQSGAPLGILEDYVGHGIGSAMHQAPDVLNYRTGHRGPRLKSGMCLAIEPMLVRGDILTEVLDDEWTIVTVDGSRASQWEHSVALHDRGIWVLTAPDGGAERLARYGVEPVPPKD